LSSKHSTGYTHSDSDTVIVLVEPQMAENIGASARAMLNCGLKTLRLVAPRDGWPSEKAEAMSSGALSKMPKVKVFQKTAEAVADCHFVAATTARIRNQVKEIYTPAGIAEEIYNRNIAGEKTAIIFGAERTGLHNDDIALANAVINIPLNPEFSSLNLAQAVLLVSYGIHIFTVNTPPKLLREGDSRPATQFETEEFLERLEQELDNNHFFRNPDMRPSMLRNIRNVYTRAGLTVQEVKTLHGMISALQGKKKPPAE
jgi:tRNA/rRNA methyltransferase